MQTERALVRGAAGRARLVVLAAAGAVCGHAITYALCYPSLALRHSVLQQTGHAYWHGAVAGALVGALWFAVLQARAHLIAAARGRVATGRFRDAATRLAVLQLVIFVSIEIIERVEVGRGLSGLLDHRLVLISGGAQVAVALVLAGAAWLLGRTAGAVGRAFARLAVRARAVRSTWPIEVRTLRAEVAALPQRGRAPPLPLS